MTSDNARQPEAAWDAVQEALPARWRGGVLATVLVSVLVAACGVYSGGGPPPAGPAAIPGVTAGDLKVNLEGRGFTCAGPGGGTTVSYACTSPGYQVLFSGSAVTSISSVSAVVLGDDSNAREFLGYIASLPYDGADPGRARSWVETNVGSSATTTIGTARFRLGGPAGGRTLDISGS